MKITKSQLKQIIKEELSKALNEDNEEIAARLSAMDDEQVIDFMNAVESDEDMRLAGRTQRYMKYPHAAKEAWFENEGWKRLNARIWTAHGGWGDEPPGVSEELFEEALQAAFDEHGSFQSLKDASEIFNRIYQNMEESDAGWDS